MAVVSLVAAQPAYSKRLWLGHQTLWYVGSQYKSHLTGVGTRTTNAMPHPFFNAFY